MSKDTLTNPQQEMFAKLRHCSHKIRTGSESTLEYSIIEYHISNGCKLTLCTSEEDEFYILDYVKNKF